MPNDLGFFLNRNIIFAWLVTVPVSGGITALLMWIMTTIVFGYRGSDGTSEPLALTSNSTDLISSSS